MFDYLIRFFFNIFLTLSENNKNKSMTYTLLLFITIISINIIKESNKLIKIKLLPIILLIYRWLIKLIKKSIKKYITKSRE
jgi:hypothetical protein